MALPVTRPTDAKLFMEARPVETVIKMTGAIIILTKATNPSPKIFKPMEGSGQYFPSITPSTMAIIT